MVAVVVVAARQLSQLWRNPVLLVLLVEELLEPQVMGVRLV